MAAAAAAAAGYSSVKHSLSSVPPDLFVILVWCRELFDVANCLDRSVQIGSFHFYGLGHLTTTKNA
jgi:hypothetical protein